MHLIVFNRNLKKIKNKNKLTKSNPTINMIVEINEYPNQYPENGKKDRVR